MSTKIVKTKNGDYKVIVENNKKRKSPIKDIIMLCVIFTISFICVSCATVNKKSEAVSQEKSTDITVEKIKNEVTMINSEELNEIINNNFQDALNQASLPIKEEEIKVKSMGAIENNDINCKKDSKIIMSDGTIKKCVFRLAKGSKLNIGDRIVGEASHYGHNDGTNGSKTADGSRFNKYAMTAASNVYPLGSVVKVTNVKNGKSVEVKITDTGGFYKNKYQRVVDMSYGSMRKITGSDLAHVDIVRIK